MADSNPGSSSSKTTPAQDSPSSAPPATEKQKPCPVGQHMPVSASVELNLSAWLYQWSTWAQAQAPEATRIARPCIDEEGYTEGAGEAIFHVATDKTGCVHGFLAVPKSGTAALGAAAQVTGDNQGPAVTATRSGASDGGVITSATSEGLAAQETGFIVAAVAAAGVAAIGAM
ncbi:hypothetical protein QBC44DRAFT_362435 [Cladorrhinum sp. PSN332]|nr:hypothetical protein QBC44DRAFT_362435 [Cladorrhinum sp. PSN332]